MLCFLSLIFAHGLDDYTLQKPPVSDKQQPVVPNYQETSEAIKRQCYNQLPENLRYLQGCLTQNGCGATDLTLSPPQEALLIQALQGKRVLDIGPGYGHTILTSLALGAQDCSVIDLSAKHIEYIKSHLESLGKNPSYLNAHVGHFPNDAKIFADNSFDAILASRVIHFLNPYGSKKENSELDRFFSEVYRILKPGGEFYVLTISPNENWKLKSRYMLRKFFRAEYPGLQSDKFSRTVDWCIPSGMLETDWYQSYKEYKKRLPDRLLFLLPEELGAIARRHEFNVSRSGEVGIPQKITQEIHNPIPAQRQTDPNTTKIVVEKAIREVTPHYTFGAFIKPVEPRRRAYSTLCRIDAEYREIVPEFLENSSQVMKPSPCSMPRKSLSFDKEYGNNIPLSHELLSDFLNVKTPQLTHKKFMDKNTRFRDTSLYSQSCSLGSSALPLPPRYHPPQSYNLWYNCKQLACKSLRKICRTRI